MIDRRFVLLFVMTVCSQWHGENLSQTESRRGFSAHVTRWVLPSWQRMMGWLKIALPLSVVGVVNKKQGCFTPFYTVLFVFSYFRYFKLPFFPSGIRETRKTYDHFRHLLWIINSFVFVFVTIVFVFRIELYLYLIPSSSGFLSSSCKPERERENLATRMSWPNVYHLISSIVKKRKKIFFIFITNGVWFLD